MRLDPQQTHALALVFHELATNALKYGAATQEQGRLNVTWSVEKASAGQALNLLWQETTPAVAAQIPGSAAGFGTHLLGLLVEGELGGTIERHPQADGLRIELSIPLPLRE